MRSVSKTSANAVKYISPFHRELAKQVARGLRNQEIMQRFRISASRLSILKGNPLFQSVVDYYTRKLDDAYFLARQRLEERAEDVAVELTEIATSDAVDAKTRMQAGFGILDRLGVQSTRAQAPGQGSGSELVFEQMLRVIKRSGQAQEQEQEQAQELDPRTKQELLELQAIEPEQELLSASGAESEQEPELVGPKPTRMAEILAQ